MDPMPVAVDEQLAEPLYTRELLCRACRTPLLYQRQERALPAALRLVPPLRPTV